MLHIPPNCSCYLSPVLVPRGHVPFSQQQESRPLGRSNYLSMCRVNFSYSRPIRFVRLDSEHAQKDGKSANRTSSVVPYQRMRFLVLIEKSAASTEENGHWEIKEGIPPSPPPHTHPEGHSIFRVSDMVTQVPELTSDLSREQCWPALLLIKKSVKRNLVLAQYRRWPWPAKDNFFSNKQSLVTFSTVNLVFNPFALSGALERTNVTHNYSCKLV